MKHEPIITPNVAGCSCGKWAPAPLQRPGESLGNYTIRAYEAHRAHVERFNSQPVQTGMFVEQFDLFVQY